VLSPALIQAAEMMGSDGVTEPPTCVARVLRTIDWACEALLVGPFLNASCGSKSSSERLHPTAQWGVRVTCHASPSSASAPYVLAGKAPEGVGSFLEHGIP
jgi:hypothetical protein